MTARNTFIIENNDKEVERLVKAAKKLHFIYKVQLLGQNITKVVFIW